MFNTDNSYLSPFQNHFMTFFPSKNWPQKTFETTHEITVARFPFIRCKRDVGESEDGK